MRVYVAGPLGYPRPGWESRANAAMEAGERIMAAGHDPYVPHLMALWAEWAAGRAGDRFHEEEWLRVCLAWVARADVLVRLPGDSPGADRETAAAVAAGIPVVSLGDLL